MPELGIFHHSDLAATQAAYAARFADGPEFNFWRSRYSAASHGDFPRWQQALAELPRIQNITTTLSDRVSAAGLVTAEQVQQLKAALSQFMPWRKGPFDLFDVVIDTEWRSDWKWQRLAPHLPDLGGQRILDVGCGNGYFGWRLLQAGARAVMGVDPTLLFCMQHLVINHFHRSDANWVIPLRFEELPSMQFDGAMSLGVVYHRRNPQAHINQLLRQLKPGGWLAVESLVVASPPSLYPAQQPKQSPRHRYARMRNVWCIPTSSQLLQWLEQGGFVDARVVDHSKTQVTEQRRTAWMQFESLAQALDPENLALTVEGYPAPRRAMIVARRPS